MKKAITAIAFVFTSVLTNAQNYCDSPVRIFTNGDFTYNYVVDGTVIDPTPPLFGCLDEIYNPAWFTFFACDKGTVEWEVSASDSLGVFQDLDYIIWGPFTSDTACVISAANIIDCDFTGLTTNTINSGSVTSLYWYKILISNYDQSDCQLLFHITSGQTVSDSSCISMGIQSDDLNSVNFYPNPFSDLLKIYSQRGMESIAISDLNGKLILTNSTNFSQSFELNSSQFNQGIYFCRVSFKDGTFVTKMLIKE